MGQRLNDIRILGLPLQFVVVVAISLALTIYFGAWTADARINSRTAPQADAAGQQFDFSSAQAASYAFGSASLQAGAGSGAAPGEGQAWERMFLFACPLH